MTPSAALVVVNERWTRSDNPGPVTVNVSSRPSRVLSAALGYSTSSRRARAFSITVHHTHDCQVPRVRQLEDICPGPERRARQANEPVEREIGRLSRIG